MARRRTLDSPAKGKYPLPNRIENSVLEGQVLGRLFSGRLQRDLCGACVSVFIDEIVGQQINRPQRGVELHHSCQRKPSALSNVVEEQVDLRERGVAATMR